jgi:hypothetical protein
MLTDLPHDPTSHPMGIAGKEIRVQTEVLSVLSRGDNNIAMKLIEKVSPEIRTIITGFEKKDGRIPTADEIIWIIGEHHKLNPRYVDNLLEDTVDPASMQTVKTAIQEHKPSSSDN